MSFKDEIYSYLSGHRRIIAAVGDRIYPHVAPSSAELPFIVWQRISSTGFRHMTASAGLTRELVQFSCWASTPESLETVSEALREALDGMTNFWLGGEDVRSATLVNEIDSFEPATDGGEEGDYRTILDVEFTHTRSVPTFA